jgi:hypothetical protein
MIWNELGGSLCHLHLQIVCRLHIYSLIAFNQVVKHQLGWNDLVKALISHVVPCKILKGQSLNTFVEMIGYWLKDARKEHFKVVDVNVFNVEKNVSIDEYMKFGATSTKKCVTLFGINIIDKAFSWCKY